jgi:hypothetical protein
VYMPIPEKKKHNLIFNSNILLNKDVQVTQIIYLI